MTFRILISAIALTLAGATLSISFATNPKRIVECPRAPVLHFEDYGFSPFSLTADHDKSTFALDVDRASYDVARMWLNNGQSPPTAAIRPEEFVNSLSYHYAAPPKGISLSLDGVPDHPFTQDDSLGLLRVVMQTSGQVDRGPMTVIVCLDRSGSMQETTGVPGQADVKFELALDLVEQLADTLEEGDRFGLVSYSDRISLDLPTSEVTSSSSKLGRVMRRLEANGSTNLFSGLSLAYEQAAEEKEMWPEREVAVILISDGAANVGTVSHHEMLQQTESYREQGIRLSTIGLGFSTLNDEILEQLGDKGDGQYIFLGYPEDRDRVIATAMTHLLPVAREARSQLEFNPITVKAWRQIGYENREMRDEEFSDNTVDAGEVGSDQSVTALYEIVLNDEQEIHRSILNAYAAVSERYRQLAGLEVPSGRSIATARVRWQDLDGEWHQSAVTLAREDLMQSRMDTQFRAAAMMARWAQLLRGEAGWDQRQFQEAYGRLLGFAFAEESVIPDDPEYEELKREISDVRNLIVTDFGLNNRN